MNKSKYFYVHILVVIILSILSGCRIYSNISSIADVDTDFSKFKTFAWLPDKPDTANLPYNNEIIRNNIRNYVGQEFAARGYSVNLDTPDILLKIEINDELKEKGFIVSPFPDPYYYCNYYYGSIYYFPYPYEYYYHNYNTYCYPPDYFIQNIEYVESSITLNIIDRIKNKLVWSGTARGNIYDEKYINKNIHPAIVAIMKKYPVKKLKNE